MEKFTDDFNTILKNGVWGLKEKECYFSWHTCEGCNSTLGGNRYAIEFKYNLHDKEIYNLSICEDCFDMLANN